MTDLDAILARLKHNEEIARKFFQVEVTILSVLDFKDLFEQLLTEIREKFAIPHVWITLTEEGELAPLIPMLFDSDVVRQRLSVVPRNTLLSLIGSGLKPILANQDLSSFYRLFPDHEKYLIRSLALAPLTLNGEAVGTLNMGDPSPERYSPGMDTTLLKRLAIKVSVCLSTVVAHERVKLGSTRDDATGLLKPSAMKEILNREFQRAVRYENTLSVVVLDIVTSQHPLGGAKEKTFIGEFKAKPISEMRKLIRVTDVVGMWEEGRFIVILPCTGRSRAKKLLDRLKGFVQSNPVSIGGQEYHLSIRAGIGCTSDAGIMDSRSLLREAQKNLARDVQKGA